MIHGYMVLGGLDSRITFQLYTPQLSPWQFIVTVVIGEARLFRISRIIKSERVICHTIT